MESYYCEICNKNVEIESKQKSICKDSGYYLIKGNLTSQEIEKRRVERSAYCNKCGETIHGVPIEYLIDAMVQRRNDRIKNLKYNIPKRNLYLCFFIVFMIPFIILLVVATYGLIILAVVVLIVSYFSYIKNKKIKEITERSNRIIERLRNDQKEFKFMCPTCASGVHPSKAI